MAAHKQPDPPAQNSKYSINVDNSTIDKLVIGDYNTLNDNRSGRSRPSQESSATLKNLSGDSDEDTVSWKRDHQLQQSKNGFTQFGASYM